jgi:hypothetical protein
LTWGYFSLQMKPPALCITALLEPVWHHLWKKYLCQTSSCRTIHKFTKNFSRWLWTSLKEAPVSLTWSALSVILKLF